MPTLSPPLLVNISSFGAPDLGPLAGPFYMALVDSNEAFGVQHHRMDEYVFSIKRTLSEGQKPMLEIEMENPGEGLLSPNRKQWAYFAWDNGSSIVPFFFGRLVGNPVQLFSQIITVQFVANPLNYKHQLQMLAEPLKVLPYWAPEWVEVGKRDDPDKILESRAAFWDVHPVDHDVIMVGITEGPAGNIDMTGDDYFYDNVNTTIGQAPESAILMDATVTWTQTSHGVVDVGVHTVTSYSDAIIQSWPKPLTQLGAGYSVFTSDAYDSNKSADAESASISYSWQNKSKTHSNGDTMSISFSQTLPMGNIGKTQILTQSSQTGVVDPFAVDSDGDPSPLNLPATFNQTSVAALLFKAVTSLVLEYRAERRRTERVIFTVRADVQPTLVDPEIDVVSESITMNGASDVGIPILNLLNWTTVSGQAVTVGQVIFPDDPQIPGGRTAQIVTVAGTAGTVPPAFSDIPGNTTTDGTVTWSSLGSAQPPDNSQDWAFGAPINPGTIILPHRPFYVPYAVLIGPDRRQFPPKGTAIHEGVVVQASNGSFQICTDGGTTSPTVDPSFSATYGVTTTQNAVTWFSLGTTLPSGTTYFIAVQASAANSGAQYHIPAFGSYQTIGARVTDGGVTWQSIGTGEIPIGGIPGEVQAASFFTQERGHRSLEYLALLVRAKLLWRARCVDVEFETDWATGIDISTRNTVTLHNPILSGGLAVGKVKSAVLSFSDSGSAICHVTIACVVGKDNAVEEADGDPTWVDDDYVDDYQWHDSVLILLPTGTDLNYSPPQYRVTDDGLTFPLTYGQAVLVDEVRSVGGQEAAVVSALASMAAAARVFPRFAGGSSSGPFAAVQAAEAQKKLLGSNSIALAVSNNPIWIEYQFKPVNAGPFNAVYNVEFSDLTLPRGIDLQAESNTT